MKKVAPYLILTLVFLFACNKEKIPPPDITDPGQLLFLGYGNRDVDCARCHGPEGQGGMQAPLITDAYENYTESQIKKIILDGKGSGADGMAGFQGELSPAELQLLLGFLKSLTAE